MGKTKSKAIRAETVTDQLCERQTNVNKLIERLNSRTESKYESDSSLAINGNSSKAKTASFSFNDLPERSMNFSEETDNIFIHQTPLPNGEVQCTRLENDETVNEIEGDINVVMKKCDSIDYIIDLIVNQSVKRDEELFEETGKVKRSHSYHGNEKKGKKFMKLKSLQDEKDSDEGWERTIMERLDNLHERAQIFEKRVDLIDSWLKKETDFNRNMRDVLEKTRCDQDDPLEDLKTIERTLTPSKDSSLISAPKADPIIVKAIDRLLDEPARDTDIDQVQPYCCHKSSENSSKRKIYCQTCKKKCSGEALRVQDKYFHINCFKCKSCKNSLSQGGFFCKDNAYYCTNDYQRQFGTKCAQCNQYVEGEVIIALGNTYHQKCFTCSRCRQAFPSGEQATYTGKEILCQKCPQIPVRGGRSPASSPTGANAVCAGCGDELKEGQALIALERQWHIWCFKCRTCETVLHGEYMGKDGVPYCEKDYQKQFGVKCAYCARFISGKVLQAGDNHHFHPTCARCTKCGDPFGDGEEMYLQGGAIWHPRCGPGPTENGTVLNGSGLVENGHCTDTDGEMSGREGGREFDRMSSSAVSETQFSFRSRTPSMNGSIGSPSSASRRYLYTRTGSPGLILREYKTPTYSENISRIYTYSYLTEEPSQGYLKKPIDPYDKPPTSPHFHRPSSSHSLRSSGSKVLTKTSSKSGMRVMAESIRSETPRPRSPHMNNEEPIELAHFPDAKKPKPGEKPKIERDDFPAPPYPYSDPERRKRYSDSYKGMSDDEEDEVDAKTKPDTEDVKLKKEEEELTKIATGIGKVFLQNVKEREKLRQWKAHHIDPRNASRVPAANKEPNYRLRYQSPVNASPSRNMDHPRPWEEDEVDHSSSYRSSVGRSVGAIPSYNAGVSSRPGSRKAATLPANRYTSGYCSDYGVGYNGDFSFSGLDKTHSTDFSSAKSDISAGSITEVDRKALNTELPASSTYQGLRYPSYSPHLRRSLPALSHMNNEPPKIYPYHLLLITNYRLPADVDRCNLERHLSDAEFEQLFQCTRTEFYRMPTWRRNEMKRRIKLF